MADITCLCLDVCGFVDFLKAVGEFYLPLLVIDADVLDLFLFADIFCDLVDVIPGIKHHGIVGAQFDGIPQSVGLGYDIVKGPFFVGANAEIGPG